MKNAADPRHLQRIAYMKVLFSKSFVATKKTGNAGVRAILKKLEGIDQLIQKSAPERPLDQINKVDLAILRVSVYELLCTETPPKVVIDEAIEIAKEYSTESAPKFINGVLASIIKELKKAV